MDLTDVAIFVAAVEAASLAAAGRRLGVAPLIASRRLASLEAQLGVRLMHRSTRALALTPEGEAFLPHAQALLQARDEGFAALASDDASASGLLRITSSGPFGRRILTPMVGDLLAVHPKLKVELLLNDALVDIVAQGVDVAVRIAPLRDSSLLARRVGSNLRGLYASPSYFQGRTPPTTVADLAAHECLAYHGETAWTFDGRHGAVRQPIQGRFTATGMEAVREACLQGLGLARLAHWDAAEDVAACKLIEVRLIDGALAPTPIWAVSARTRSTPAKVRVFVEALQVRLRSLA
ncbi:LysR family transcriptional regulator [Caulobacter segnis]|uniref:LysR family transcriptional regulator n=1 Tax=Caulobacter segnis TaxID=88688 RepID=UPI00240EEB48|nr:LysR family transcriptional regulator [Caulobacter segnis]MDG2520743.1 LysR family transcriptional regulator [Caulobacter segnis]